MNPAVRTWIGHGLMVLGIALFAYYFGVTLESRSVQAQLGKRLEALVCGEESRVPLARAGATRDEARTSGMIGRLEIPRLGLSAIVVDGVSGRALQRGVGHVHQSAFPGERGNVALAAHRDTYFRPLAGTKSGDRIWLRTPDGAFEYRVDSILIVPPSRADLIGASDDARLTLVTCYPFYWIGPAPKRFVVQARLAAGSPPLAALPTP